MAPTQMVLRAPLPGSLVKADDSQNDIRPVLYRMFVACHVLRLGQEARFSALVLFHRYFQATATNGKRRTDNDGDEWKWIAAACLFLACKAEEEPRRLRDVINLAHIILSTETQARATTPTETTVPHYQLDFRRTSPSLNEKYWEAKKKIVETEQALLRWLSFDTSISHPHRAVILLTENEPIQVTKTLAPIAFRLLNDALFHAPALAHGVLEMACAAVSLAIEEAPGCETTMKTKWWSVYQISDEAVASSKKDLKEATDRLKQFAGSSG
jgi:hypothetical protein